MRAGNIATLPKSERELSKTTSVSKKPSANNSNFLPLSKDGFIPLYYQIQQALMQKIQSGELSVGDPLDSEEELSRRYQVSRMTARQALHVLKAAGYAVSHKGRGTFVARPKLEKNIMHLRGFTEDMRQRGMEPSSRILEKKVVIADEDLMQKLRLGPNEKVLRLRRLRLADRLPMALEESNIPLRNFPGLEDLDFSKQSLYQTLRERYKVDVSWADETIEALPATRDQAALLTIPQRSSMLSISRVVRTMEEVPIEATNSLYRGDRYRALIRVHITPGE